MSVLRLNHLERKVIEDVGKTPDIICELKSQVESFKRKLEVCWLSVTRCSRNM